jgi:tripartite-type tricarboxylate transporter receptor subunit TctC
MAVVLLLAAAAARAADTYPNRVIKMIAPFPAGGATDVAGRLLAHRMSASLGQAVIIENRAGASGAIGVLAGAEAAADGYTLLVGGSSTVAVNPHVTKVTYDMARDFRPVSLIMKAETLIVAHPSTGFRSLADVVAAARKSPGKLTFGNAGTGSAHHLALVYLQMKTGIDVLHVPYKGAAPSELAMVAGEIDVLVVNTVSALPHIEAGKMIPIALLSSAKSQAFPTLPRASDFVAGYVFDTWLGLYAPVRTSDAIVSRLNRAAVDALTDPKLVEDFRAKGMEPAPGSATELQGYQSAESARWAEAAAAARAKGWLD